MNPALLSAIFAGLAVVGGAVAAFAAWNRKDGGLSEWRTHIDDTIDKHDRYHSQHFDHAASRLMHPDPEIVKSAVELLRQSQLAINEKLGEHIEQDNRIFEKLDRTIDRFREEFHRNNEIMAGLVEQLISKLGE
jgi:hypothetical protein